MGISRDGKRLASAGTGEVTMGDPDRGEAFRVLNGHCRPVSCVTFPEDGAGIFLAHQDRVTCLVGLPGGGCLENSPVRPIRSHIRRSRGSPQ